jgi:hypothetical protein
VRPGLHAETESEVATVQAVVRFRDQLLADGHDPTSIGIAMTSIGAAALCGKVRDVSFYPVPEGDPGVMDVRK